MENSNVIENVKKCTGCGSKIFFDINKRCLVCEHCSSTFPVEISTFNQKEKFTPENLQSEELKQENLSLICSACGATIETQSYDISHTCPFCGSSKITTDMSTLYDPQGIVLFSVDKNEVQKHFKKWVKKRFFAPSDFKKLVVYDKTHQVYTPSWLFDTNVKSSYNGVVQYDRTETYRVNGKTRTRTVTENKKVSGIRDDNFADLMIPSFRNLSYQVNELMPFDLTNMVNYNKDIVLGVEATQYTVDLKTCWQTATMSMQNTIKRNIVRYYHADRCSYMNISSTYTNCNYSYVLFPIWEGNYYYKNKNYDFYINGTTGKVTGKSPVSKLKVFFLVIFIIALLVGLGILCYNEYMLMQ